MRLVDSDLSVGLGDGTAIGFTEVGNPDGFPVIHMHGNPGSRLDVSLPAVRGAAESLGVRLVGMDRPGIGLSTFHRFSLGNYPERVGRFADALALEEFGITGVSGGAKYATACAVLLPDRVRRVALVSSTCSQDLPGAKATPNSQDRLLYPLADHVPWLVRPIFAKLTHDARRDPDSLVAMLDRLGPADQALLADESFREALARSLAEAFRQGGRGVAQDYTIEARPWGVDLDDIRIPVDIWHGEDDRLVSADAGRILAEAINPTTTHFEADAGHLMLSTYALDILRSVTNRTTTTR